MVYFSKKQGGGTGYTKPEADAKFATKQELSTKVDTNTANATYATKQALATLQNTVNDNITDIGTKANSADVYRKTEVYTKTETDNKYLDKTREGVLPHKFTIQSNDENLKLKSNEGVRSVYIGFYKGSGNDRVGYIGRASGSNHHMQVVAEKADGNVILQAGANGVVECRNKRVIDVATPTANNDATNKAYVDTALRNKANTGTSYTKAESDAKYATTASVNTKANDNEVVKLTGNQTITGNKRFNNIQVGEHFDLTPENGAMRIAPKADGKWLYFGNPNTKYFAGIDLNNRVNLNGVKTPTENSQAANKAYVDSTVNNAVNSVKLKQIDIKKQITTGVNTDLITGLGPNKKVVSIDVFRKSSVGDQWYSKRPRDTYRLFKFPDKITINTSVEQGFSNEWWIVITYFEY